MVSSSIKLSYVLPILLLGVFFSSICIIASLQEESIYFKIGIWVFAAAIIFMVWFHIYSIPKISIGEGNIVKSVRGKIRTQVPISRISSINYLVQGEHTTRGKRVHRLHTKDEVVIISTQYYSNLDVLINVLDQGDQLNKNQLPSFAFSMGSITHSFKVLRSFTACSVVFIVSAFVYALYRILMTGQLMEGAMFTLLFLSIALMISFFGMVQVTGFTRIEGDKIVEHMPFFLIKKVIPISSVKVCKLEKVNTGRGGTIYNLALLLQNLNLQYSSVQLNTNDEIEKMLKRING